MNHCRHSKKAPAEQVRRLLTAAYVLTGSRVPRQMANQLFQGARAIRESDTYMAILEEGIEEGREKGHLEEAKKLILRLGRKSLGAPDAAVTAALDGFTDLERLERIHERLGDVKSWQELLATP